MLASNVNAKKDTDENVVASEEVGSLVAEQAVAGAAAQASQAGEAVLTPAKATRSEAAASAAGAAHVPQAGAAAAGAAAQVSQAWEAAAAAGAAHASDLREAVAGAAAEHSEVGKAVAAAGAVAMQAQQTALGTVATDVTKVVAGAATTEVAQGVAPEAAVHGSVAYSDSDSDDAILVPHHVVHRMWLKLDSAGGFDPRVEIDVLPQMVHLSLYSFSRGTAKSFGLGSRRRPYIIMVFVNVGTQRCFYQPRR